MTERVHNNVATFTSACIKILILKLEILYLLWMFLKN
jgi:hypothetical protein